MSVEIIHKKTFSPQNHYYEKVLNANCSTAITYFMDMEIDRLLDRYSHLNPSVNKERLRALLTYKPKYFAWAGADLFNVTTEENKKQMVLIETNSCPSGQKSMPTTDKNEQGGYYKLVKKTIKPLLEEQKDALPEGSLAVIYDKNKMEAWGYAAVMADVFAQDIYLVEYLDKEKNPPVKFDDQKVMHIRLEDGQWIPIKAAFRYVTQKPWDRIPINTKTLIFNPMIACIAGGRNKLVADMAYEFLNSECFHSGLKVNVPYTVRNVSLKEIPLWISSFGGIGVVKNPYSNAGQGVWTITNKQELANFLKEKQDYDQFIVQGLIGNYNWSSKTPNGKMFHVGTLPNKKNEIFVADLRMMVHYDYVRKCFRPLAMYGRSAAEPLREHLDADTKSWEILGTNLSRKLPNGKWDTETTRLLLMDSKDFNKLGLGIDDLINGFIQTVLAVVAIDKMAAKLFEGNIFNQELFSSINSDDKLLKEIVELNGCSKNEKQNIAVSISPRLEVITERYTL